MNPYVKVMYGTTSGANSSLQYKINEVNVSNHGIRLHGKD